MSTLIPTPHFQLRKPSFESPAEEKSAGADSSAIHKNEGLGFQIIAPSFQVNNGTIRILNTSDNSPDSIAIRNLNMTMFVELTDEQRFLDIDELQFDVPELDIRQLEAYGQIYNDERFFEVNALTVSHENSTIRFNGEVDGTGLFERQHSASIRNRQL
ncbi:hypothetical protein [Rhodohalobacter sp.]|uniref:hypothetical protein n=1 Tax=Rhodohalobacter sp. TaxID=1974210 RepID=UPI002ACD4ED4|nr:hypothetical protein [Rhodohalobacter sp.]MDZ7756113.1 hypothetical protein [Rhodohalobacter sp.]